MRDFVINPLDYMCHCRKDRSFQINGHYFPVCARCTGVYVGVAFILIIMIVLYPTYLSFFYGILLILPIFIDGSTQLIGLRSSNNTLRVITGFFGGIGLVILLPFVRFILTGN